MNNIFEHQSDFSNIVEVEGKLYLCNPTLAERRRQQIPEFVAVLNDARSFLKDGEFPDDIDSVFEILDRGRDGLLNIIWSRADAEAERLHVQKYVAETWRQKEREAVTREQWEAADAIKGRYDRAVNDFPILKKFGITEKEDGTIGIKDDGITETIEKECRIEITEAMRKDLDSIKDIADKVKALELSGINAMEIIGGIIRDPGITDGALINKYIFRRHAPGHIAPGSDDSIYKKVVETLNAQSHGNL